MSGDRFAPGGRPETTPEDLLLSWGADQLEHPGGTLFGHLLRVRDRLAAWGASSSLQRAGLCHAVYGTDGFAPHLVDVSRRTHVAALLGAEAEALVYRYASCDRGWLYPRLAAASEVLFRDRFTGQVEPVQTAGLRAFMELTVANELDIAAHNPAFAAAEGPKLYSFVASTRHLVSPAAWHACLATVGP